MLIALNLKRWPLSPSFVKLLRIMNLIIILLTTMALQVSAKGYTQIITLDVKDQPIEKVFAEIKRQAGYTFTYTQDVIDKIKTVTLHVKNATIHETLDQCFKGKPFTYKIVDKIISIDINPVKHIEEKQERSLSINVKGRVMNEKGEPVEGVTITIKGTRIATSTDASGEFSLLTVDPDAILVFTSVNMETFELKVSGKTDLTINLKTKVTALADVQVMANTGYQTVKPNEVTGSLVVIDNKTLNQQTGTNILQRLNNVTSGLLFNIGKINPNNTQNTTGISIRGLSTINGPLDPLIVLDNFIFEGDINNINPNDVESISILKDAAATSIWGARAGNGVIVITTKKGRFNQKLKIDFNSNLIITQKPELDYLSSISTSDYIDVEQYIFNLGYFNSAISNTSNRPALTPAVEVFLKRQNGLISATDSATQIDALKKINSRDQYKKYFYQQAVTQQYSLNLNGGSGNNAWLVSGAYDNSIYTLRSKYDKLNLRFNNSYKPTKNLQLDLSVYYTSSKATSGLPSASIDIAGRQIPYLKFADNNGKPLSINRYNSEYIDTVGGGKLLDWKLYPLEEYKHNVSTTRVEEIVANVGLNYQIIPALKLNINYQYQKQTTNFENLADLQSFYTRDLINAYTQIDYAGGSINNIIPKGSILRQYNTNINSQNFRGQINYNKYWKENSLAVIVGTEIREVIGSGNQVSYYGYNPDPLSYGTVDYVNSYPTLVPGYSLQIPNAPFLFSTTNNRFVSFYGNASYSFKQKYSLYGSVRRDGSNVFGQITNDKWNPLWSSGIAWDISKEKFYHIKGIPGLKLKTTYGYSGNVDITKTPLAVALGGFTNTVTNFPVYRINNLNNPSLRWEKVNQLNIGIEFSLKNQLLSGSIDFYHKKGFDLYGATPFDYTAWGLSSTLTKNVANMKGTGVDVVLRSKNIDKTIKWTSVLLLNYNTSKTTAYFTPAAKNVFSLLQAGRTIFPVIGYPLYSIAAYKWAGLNASGDPQGYLSGIKSTNYNAIRALVNKAGLDSGNLVYVGRSSPPLFGALINEFSWKGFSASFNISYNFGYYFRKTPFTSGQLINSGVATADYEKRWQKPGDELLTNVPAFVYTNYPQFNNRDAFYASSEINVLKADNIRLQYFNIGYAIAGKKIKLPLEQLQVYFNAANLGILWRANKEHLDPDYPNTLPLPKSFTVGVRATF